MADKRADYAALEALLQAISQAGDLRGIIERVLVLEAEVAPLEKKKAALQKDVTSLTGRAAKAKEAAEAAEAEHQAILATLKGQREAEAAGLEQDRARRAEAERTALLSIQTEHARLSASLRDQRQEVFAEIRALTEKKAALEKGLDELVATVKR